MPFTPRILILGAGGFVGGYLRAELAMRYGDSAEIVATTRGAAPDSGVLSLDLCDSSAIADALKNVKPTHVVNLVGIAAPGAARSNREAAWHLHARAPEILGELILQHVPDCWLLHVSSGLIYGRSALSGRALTEKSLLAPMDPYAVTKAAGDIALGAMAGEGLKCLRLRPFNHTGPGQTEDFVVPAFASQLASIAAGLQPPVIRVGNLEAERDFLDVRDVVAAYVALIAGSSQLVPGSIYNVASGKAVSMRYLLDRLIALSGISVTIEADPARQRPSDLPRIAGDSDVLHRDTGWSAKFTLDQTLSDTLKSFYPSVSREPK